ncbi:hypothetical protein, partial [Morganella morganii]
FAAVAGLLRCCEAAYITFPAPSSQAIISYLPFSFFLPDRVLARCSVSVEVHYRESLSEDKCLFQLFFCSPLFSPQRCFIRQNPGDLL